MNKNNILYINILKILSSIAVVTIHVSAIEWNNIDVNNTKWLVINIYNSACRWAVPIFVMITGTLLLRPEKEISIKNVFFKYIKKILILIIFWEFVYAFVVQINSQEKWTFDIIWDRFKAGYYHLYYLYLIIGIYLITPIIKFIINQKNDGIIKYYLILWFVFQIVINTVIILLELFDKNNIVSIVQNKLYLNFIIGYTGYYILGYYLNSHKQSKKCRYIIYILGVIGYISTIGVTKVFNKNTVLYGYFSLNTFFMAIAVYIFVKELLFDKNINEKLNLFIQKLAKLTLGVYLLHPIFIIIMEKLEITMLVGNMFIMIPVVVAIVYLFSLITTYILSKIPIIGKYIV